MARPISVESRIFRGVTALAMALSTAGCSRKGELHHREGSEINKEQPLSCGLAEVYPLDDGFPAEASYLVERPLINGCAIRIFLDEYQDVYLLIYRDKFEVIVFEALIGRYYVVDTGALPAAGEPYEFSRKNVRGEMSLTREGNYLVEYQSR